MIATLLLSLCLVQVEPKAAKPDYSAGRKMVDAYFRDQVKDIESKCLVGYDTLDKWQKAKPELRKQLFEMLGLSPMPAKTDLKATVTGVIDAPKYTIEKLHFQSMPGLYVFANLYVPKPKPKNGPAILYVCGHGNNVKDGVSYGSKTFYQHHAHWYAEHGYTCLIIDTLQLSEIPGLHHGTYRDNMWWWQSLGYTPAGVECWNGIRALDYLETRPEVDIKRVGLTGRSGGGAYSWWIAACDDRPAAIVPVAGIADLRAHLLEGEAERLKDGVIAGHCDCMFMVNKYRWDFAQVAALIAPRPLLLGNSDKDEIFPVGGYRRLAAKVSPIYKLFGREKDFQLLETQGPHSDTPELRLGAYKWMNKHLKGETGEVTEEPFTKRDPAELKVFQELPKDAINAKVHETFRRTPAYDTSDPISMKAWASIGATLRRSLSERTDPASAIDSAHMPLIRSDSPQAKINGAILMLLDEQAWEFRESLHQGVTSASLIWTFPLGKGSTRWAVPGSKEEVMMRRRYALIGKTWEEAQIASLRHLLQKFRKEEFKVHSLNATGDMAVLAICAALVEPSLIEIDIHDPTPGLRGGPAMLGVLADMDVPQVLALLDTPKVRVNFSTPEKRKAFAWAEAALKTAGKRNIEFTVVGK